MGMYKSYKQILEAVNRGIKFAIDDFDDNELIGQQTQTIKDIHYTKEYLDAMKQFVDLGLPSGNLWCKYNLDAPVSKMKDISHAGRVDYIGGFYAWGEIEERFNNFTQQAYKFSKFNSGNLPLQNDAAYVSNNYPFKIYMPSYDDYNELKNNTTLEFKENYNGIKGLNGIIYKSNVNDNELFIPNISYKQSDFDRDKITVWDGTSFGCWTNTASHNDEKAYMMYCSKTTWYGAQITYSCNNIVVYKWYGAQIRPIIKKRG